MGERKNSGAVGFAVTILVAVVAVALIQRCPSAARTDVPARSGGSAKPAPAAKGSDRPFSGPGYVLNFSKDFNPGANAVDDLGLSVVIAVDVSGSMADAPASGGDPKYVQASRALSGIVTFLETLSKDKSMAGLELKVALVSFYEEVQVLYPLAKMDEKALSSLRALLSDPNVLKPGGKTAIGKTLETGAEILAGSGTVMKSLIVVSDGENTAGTEPGQVLRAINENRNSASTVDFPVYTRGILASFVGFDVDSDFFSPLSEEGARVTSAADQAGLKKALTDILVADISKLEAAQ